MTDTTKVLSVEQVSKELGVSINLIYRLARTGKMQGWIRVGDRWLISRVNVDKFINGEGKA